MAKRVLIGLSGGVDSAVAAYLLKEQGYQVEGGFMRNWDSLANNDYLGNPTINDDQCAQETDYDDAVAVANKLDIKLHRVDFVEEYWNDVFVHFLKEYEKGRTPNPDIFCNKYIKFAAFLNFAKAEGFDYIATGHYAKKVSVDDGFLLLKSFDKNKDQTYFLSQLSQEQIAMALFPLGDIDKTVVRTIAHQLDLKSVMDKKDSTGICFIGERHFKEFLKNYLPAKPGAIVDIESKRTLGEHDGVLYYTIGQRKGLGIGGIKNEKALGWFVVNKDVEHNILYVASGSEAKHLLSDGCLVKTVSWTKDAPAEQQKVMAKFRYRQDDNPVTISRISADSFLLTYDHPIKAVTPGQAAVLYDGDVLLGGGIIEETYYLGKRIL